MNVDILASLLKRLSDHKLTLEEAASIVYNILYENGNATFGVQFSQECIKYYNLKIQQVFFKHSLNDTILRFEEIGEEIDDRAYSMYDD